MGSWTAQIVIAYAAGIFFGSTLPVSFFCFLPFSIPLLPFLYRLIFQKIPWKTFFLWCFVCVGIFSYHIANTNAFRSAEPFSDEYVTLIGKITEIPTQNEERFSYVINTPVLIYQDERHPIRERVRFSSDAAFSLGDSVKVEGFLEHFEEPLNSGDFHYGHYYKSRGIYYRLSNTECELSTEKVHHHSLPYLANCIKDKIRQAIRRLYAGDAAAILESVLLGYKKEFSDELETSIFQSNTMRMFYPTYLHLILLNMLAGIVMTYFSKNKRTAFQCLLLIFYCFWNTNLPAGIKTAMLAMFFLLQNRIFGYSSYIKTLFCVVGIMLFYEPLLLFNRGIILSVGFNLTMIYLFPVIEEKLYKVQSRGLRRFLSVWLTSILGMLPILTYVSHYLNLYGILISTLTMPILCVLWLCAPLTLLLYPVMGAWCPFFYATNGAIYLFCNLPDWTLLLPGSAIALKRFDFVTVLIYYLSVLLICLWIQKQNKNYIRLTAAALSGFLLVNGFFFFRDINRLQIRFVSVGQGDGTIISVPFCQNILLDGGGGEEYTDYNSGETVFIPYALRNGYQKINLAIVSHFHGDHCRGIITALEKLDVMEIVMPDTTPENPYRKEIERIAREKGIKCTYPTAGDIFSYPSGLTLQFISPDRQDLNSSVENNSSLVIRVSYGKFSALFCGDIHAAVERKYAGLWGEADVLKVAHHGSATSTTKKFLEEVNPTAALIGVGYDNLYQLPDARITDLLQSRGISVYRTDRHGDIRISASKSGNMRIDSYRR